MTCNKCGGRFGTVPSDFPGFLLLACVDCGRPVKLIPEKGPRVKLESVEGKAAVNRALRAARRMKARQA